MVQEDTSTDIVTVEAEEISEESPLLVAQRYLNIFHQIHIFKAKKRAEFDVELLNMDEKVKRLLITLPGGRVLLEHILELEEKNNFDTQLTKALIAQRKKNDSLEIASLSSPHAQSNITGEVHLSNDFANVLAKSLASALGRAPYLAPLPQITDNNGEPVTNSNGELVDADGNQLNTQNNVAATTVNNINMDYSIFQNLADAINRTNSSLAQTLKENNRQHIEELKIFGKTLAEALITGRTGISLSPTVDTKITEKRQPLNMPKTSSVKNTSTKQQTVSVTNKTIDPLTSKSTIEKTSYSIPSNTSPTNAFKPQPPKKDPMLQAQNVLSRTGLNVKPVSLSVEDNTSSFTPTAKKAYEEYSLDENLNMNKNFATASDSEWEYVDEYGNPVSDIDGEWEYVDEYGNPISDADAGWEYVDEYGNSIPASAVSTAQQAPVMPTKFTPPSPVNKVQNEIRKTVSEPKPVVEQSKPENQVEIKEKVEKPEKDTVNDILAAAFAKPTEEATLPEKTKEEKNSAQPQEVQKEETAKPEKETKGGGIFSSLFKKKENQTATETQKEQPEKDTVDDALAAAFTKPTEETATPEKDNSVDPLAAAFAKPAEPSVKTEEAKADDILANAFAQHKPEADAEIEEEKKDKTPRMGGILAEAFQKVEKEQKTISSKDLLAQAYKNKPQTTADVLASAFAKTEEHKKDADDVLAAAFKQPEKDQNEEKTEFDALIKAFNS